MRAAAPPRPADMPRGEASCLCDLLLQCLRVRRHAVRDGARVYLSDTRLNEVHRAMSDEIVRDRASMKSLCTPSADARVASFLGQWVDTRALRGARTDCINLRLTREEIGNYLGLRLESVSRALTRLAREGVIGFAEAKHREVQIRDADALTRFVPRAAQQANRLLPC